MSQVSNEMFLKKSEQAHFLFLKDWKYFLLF